jgi:carbon-monoxide dehydrogenase small subunit
MPDTRPIAFTLNGQTEEVRASPCDSLADILRNTLDMTATHIGCNEGVCGACTVLVDGMTVRSCMVLAGQVNGHRVETVEGYSQSPVRQVLQGAFVNQFAAQCGFCTPGMLAVGAEFLEDLSVDDHSDEAAIRDRLKAVLCRCTGYHNVVAAIAEAARELRNQRSG